MTMILCGFVIGIFAEEEGVLLVCVKSNKVVCCRSHEKLGYWHVRNVEDTIDYSKEKED
jgi:hypothetical protein